MTSTARTAADTGLPHDSEGAASAPRKLSHVDLIDSFTRIRNLAHMVGVAAAMVEGSASSAALGELGWTLDERCDAFYADLALALDVKLPA